MKECYKNECAEKFIFDILILIFFLNEQYLKFLYRKKYRIQIKFKI